MRLNSEELKLAFRIGVSGSANPGRQECPDVDVMGRMMQPDMAEAERLAIVDHISHCLPCAREFAALRLLHEGHQRIAPLIPDSAEALDREFSRAEAAEQKERTSWWRRLAFPVFGLAAVASLIVALLLGVVLLPSLQQEKGLVAVAPLAKAESPNLVLQWKSFEGAAKYTVTMSWPSGKVFLENGDVRDIKLNVPPDAVAQMKRGQTCLWTLRAIDPKGNVLAEKTFSFVVGFDPPQM